MGDTVLRKRKQSDLLMKENVTKNSVNESQNVANESKTLNINFPLLLCDPKEEDSPKMSTKPCRRETAELSSSLLKNESDEDVDKQLNRAPKRSASLHNERPEKVQLERCHSLPEDNSTISDLIAGSRHLVEEAEEIVKQVIDASWNLVYHHELPKWLQDNEHLVLGHRLPLNSFAACFKSIFQIHTETGNIWTHIVGMVAFIIIAVYTLSSRYIDWMWQDITVHSVFFGGAITCLTFSWMFHTVFCHSEFVNKLFSKLDYCGIALLTVGSFVPWLYYGFFCQQLAHLIYLVSIIILGTSCIIVSLWDQFAAPSFRPLRAGLFIALGLTGVVPACHLVLLEGLHAAVSQFGLLHLIIMAFLYIGGAVLYAFRIPESIYPGKFDIWFQSHQIFHICVIAAALVHFNGIQYISHARLNFKQCLDV